MNYFDLFPNVDLPSFSDKRKSSYDYITLKNLFKRARIRDDIYGSVTAFSKYVIIGVPPLNWGLPLASVTLPKTST